MGDAPARMVDPTVLVPVVLLVVAEFGTLARDLDLRAAVAEERPPLVVDFVIHGALVYPKVLRRRTATILGPVASVLRGQTTWSHPAPGRPNLPERAHTIAGTAKPFLLPNLGQFGFIHLMNAGLLVFTFAVTRRPSSAEATFVQYFLAFVVLVLPLLEVGEYDAVQSEVDPVYSFAFHLAVNVGIVTLVLPSTSVLDAGRPTIPDTLRYVVWWLGAGYLYLVVLAIDIRRITTEERYGDKRQK